MSGPYNPPVKNQAWQTKVSAWDMGAEGTFRVNPTIASGDWKVDIDGAGFNNLSNLPSVSPAGGIAVLLNMTAAEMNGDVITITGVDQTSPKEWADVFVCINTTASGVTLSAASIQAIWDALTSALTTAGSIGKRIVDFLTGDAFTRLGAPAGASVSADVAAIKTDTGNLTTRLTSARAGYLDNLNVGGAVASQADVQAVNQSASKHILLTTVQQFERPESGTTVYTVEARTFAAATGAAVNADSTPTLTATGQTSGNLSGNLSAASNPATGVYRWTYTVSSGDTVEPIRFDVSATISSATFTLSAYAQVLDEVAATFTSTDKSNLTAIFNKLPSTNIADETDLLAIDTKLGVPVTDVSADIAAVLAKTPDSAHYTNARGDVLDNLDATVSSRSNFNPDINIVEGSFTWTQMARLWSAPLLGKASGLATTSVVYRDTSDTKNRVSATVDADGNRSSVVLDAS